jgi:ABC-2 type transport system permease protein
MKQLARSVDTIITVLVMPIMTLLAFRYILGGAMSYGSFSSADYILPGVLMFSVLNGVAYTAFRLSADIQKGIFLRFHSMPISKSSILGGHVLASTMANMLSAIAVCLAGLLAGFRPQASFSQWLLAVALTLMFTLAMTWISVFFGLIAKSVETSSTFSYLLIGLGFAGSLFAPVDSMPKGLAAFARVQPMTPIADSLRLLLLGKAPNGSLWIAIAWCAGIITAFWLLSIWAYKARGR